MTTSNSVCVNLHGSLCAQRLLQLLELKLLPLCPAASDEIVLLLCSPMGS
jgi:hypothetical protein